MKLSKLFETVENNLYHSSPIKFTKFKNQVTWFATNESTAKAWHKNGFEDHDKQITYICKYDGAKIASVKETAKYAKEIWPEDELLYSMFDASVSEFPKAEVVAFIKLLKKAGFEAAWIEDYDPENFNSGSTLSLCVFQPSETVTITGTLLINGESFFDISEKRKASEFKVGETIWFKNDAMLEEVGKIVVILNKGEKIPVVPGYDASSKHEDDQPGKPAYGDRLYVETQQGELLEVALYHWQRVGKLK